MPQREGVGANPVPILRCAEVLAGVAAGVYKTPVVVRRKSPISGDDFLAAPNCGFLLRHKLFTVGRERVECFPEGARVSHARLKLARRVELPLHTELLVSCNATRVINTLGRPAQ